MRDMDGRGDRASLCQGAARRALPTLIACCLVAAYFPSAATGSTADDAEGRWIVRALASDTGCVVLDDGRARRLCCTGDQVARDGARLLRVEPDAAVFEVDTGLAAPLVVRVAAGAAIDAQALRERMREVTGPRPGWIEPAPSGLTPAREREHP